MQRSFGADSSHSTSAMLTHLGMWLYNPNQPNPCFLASKGRSMKTCRFSFTVSMLTLASVLAQPPLTEGPPEVIIHKTNPHEGGAPTAGSTGVQTPLITYHGGPVMATPTAYLIWYGNWNQTNGSDTPAGQSIVNDFLYGLS